MTDFDRTFPLLGKLEPKIPCYLWAIIKDSSSPVFLPISSLNRDQSKSWDKDRWYQGKKNKVDSKLQFWQRTALSNQEKKDLVTFNKITHMTYKINQNTVPHLKKQCLSGKCHH